MDHLKKEYFVCECHSDEHMINFWYDEDDNELHIGVHLYQPKFWDRVKIAVKYIFGYRSKYGEWDDFLVKPEDADKIKSCLEKLKLASKNTTIQSTSNFVKDCMSGISTPEDIDDYIDFWHNDYDTNISLSAFLGMTWEEYGLFVIDASQLPNIIEAYKKL